MNTGPRARSCEGELRPKPSLGAVPEVGVELHSQGTVAAVGHHGRAQVRGHCQGCQGGHRDWALPLPSSQGHADLPQGGTITAVKDVWK